jgi:hypothetical protein
MKGFFMNDTICNNKIPRTFVFTNDQSHDECIKILVEQKKIDLVRIIEGDNNNNNNCSFSLNKFYELGLPKLFAENNKIPISKEMIASYPDFFRQHYATFHSMLGRVQALYGVTKYDQIVSYFNILYRYFYHVLKSNNIELIILFYIPHYSGYDEILYQVARLLNIKTILFHSTIFPNKIFIIPKIEALLEHDQLLVIDEHNTIEIQQTTPFYMHDILKKQKQNNIESYSHILRFVYDIMSNLLLRSKNVFNFFRNKIYKLGQSKTNKRKFVAKGIRYIYVNLTAVVKGAIHLKRVNKFAKRDEEIDWNIPYIYFPLHMQPELTTTPLGGIYENQLYAIECIINLIPDNWKIFVKEHPAQFSTGTMDPMYWRDWSFFYKRIQQIPQIVLISNKVDTNKLIENSKFVSTITGTVGWEAILADKSVLYFGIAWYGSFSGCTKFSNEITLETILENKPDRNKIKDDIDKLATKLVEGIHLPLFDKTIKDFNVNHNAQTIADALGKYIEYYFPH